MGDKDYQLADMRSRSTDLYAQAKYDILLGWLGGLPSLKVLVAGCGSGELACSLARAGHRVLGIDPEREYIQMARALARRSRLEDCSFYESAIEDLPRGDLFDAVVSTDVLEHIEDDRAALGKLASLLRPRGLVAITVPENQSLFGYHDEKLGHFRRYSRRGLLSLMQTDFDVEQVRSFGFFCIPMSLLYGKVLRREYPVSQGGRSAASTMVSLLLNLEKAVPLPTGTSLLALGRLRR